MRLCKSLLGNTLVAMAALVVGASVIGCSDFEDYIGSNFLPDDQIMESGQVEMWGTNSKGTKILSSRLFRTDRINTSNLTYGTMGIQYNEVFGGRRSGFFAQYTPVYELTDYVFGHEPILDSLMIYIDVGGYAGDTTQKIVYEVYEVLDDSFLRESADTTFNVDFEFAAGALSSEPIFEFTFPDQDNEIYMSTNEIRGLNVTDAGRDLADRLMLSDGELSYKIYKSSNYDDFLEYFKGVYIAPKSDETITTDEGVALNITLASSGLGIYARSVYEDYPEIVKDTVGMTYIFRDETADVGGISINTVDNDYTTSQIDFSIVKSDSNPDVPTTNVLRVEGMGGIISEITLEKGIFEELELKIAEADGGYEDIFFNNARLRIYVELADGSDFFFEDGEVNSDKVDLLDNLSSRLALYNNFSTFYDSNGDTELDAVADYSVAYELQGYITLLSGFLYRSQGCYTMNIPMELQERWTDYKEAKAAAGGDIDNIDWDSQTWNKLYLAPIITNLFTTDYVSLQGESGADCIEGIETAAPMRLDISYTLLRK